MMRLPRRGLWGLLAVVTLAASACSSSGGSGAVTVPDAVDRVPKEWSAGAVTDIQDLAERLAAVRAGECGDFKLMPTADFANTIVSMQIATVIPRAVGACTIGGENVEIVLFKSTADRDRFVDERRERICTIAARQKLGLPGLRFVKGDGFTLQPDSQTVALDMIEVVGGKYDLASCPGQQAGDWDRASVQQVRALAAKLDAAGHACDLVIEDKDLSRRTPHYIEVGLPGVLASCDVDLGDGTAPTLGLVGFESGGLAAGTFLPRELAELCKGGADVRVVRGDGWAGLVAGEAAATEIAETLGGTVDALDCAEATRIVNATSTTTSSTTTTTKP